LPIKVQSGDNEEETSQIYYNGDFQVTKVTGGQVSDPLWLPVDSNVHRYEWGASSCESCGSEKKLTKIIDSGNKQWEFKYDMMGNVIEMIYPDLSKIEQRFDVAGRLEWFKNKRGQEITYAYDADGNLVQERNKASGELKKYFYNAENRLTGYEHYANEFTSVNQIAQYTYDLYGRRIQKTVNGIVTNFLWDEDNISLEYTDNNQPIRRYVYGVGMDNVEGHFEYLEATSNPFATDHRGWYTYIKDQVGTIYKTFSHERQVVNSRVYNTFGNLISQSGTPKSPLGFQSKYLDTESGLYYFYHRYYSPSLGRFTTEDPIGLNGGFDMYVFVGNNSVNKIDHYGLKSLSITPWTYFYYRNETIKEIKDTWHEVFGDDICEKEKKCQENCFSALQGKYECEDSRYAQLAYKFAIKQLAQFIFNSLKPVYFYIGEKISFRIACSVLCKNEEIRDTLSGL